MCIHTRMSRESRRSKELMSRVREKPQQKNSSLAVQCPGDNLQSSQTNETWSSWMNKGTGDEVCFVCLTLSQAL